MRKHGLSGWKPEHHHSRQISVPRDCLSERLRIFDSSGRHLAGQRSKHGARHAYRHAVIQRNREHSMKKRILQGAIFALLGLSIGWAFGQTPSHTVTLTVASPDTSSGAPGTATILRAAGACPASGVPSSGTTLTSTLSVPGQ